MTGLRAAIGVLAALAVGVALVSGGLEKEPEATQLLEIPGIGGGGTTVVVDSLGSVIGEVEAISAAMAARRRLRRARPLDGAPRWAQRMYSRSLLVLWALTDRRGAAIAGAREGWAYVWPRDAGTVALAFAAAGYRAEARRVARFLLELDLDAAARFYRNGTPVEDREAQGDAWGWVEVAARAAGLPGQANFVGWRDRADYQEKGGSDYLGNAIASGVSDPRIWDLFAVQEELKRRAGDPDSGVDSVAAWAVQPFPQPALFPAVRHSLHRLVDERKGRFGILPSEDWPDEDPWTAPTAWTAWAFAALARGAGDASPSSPVAIEDRRAALELMNDLRRASTPLGLLPERIDAQTGEPRSTTPLAWSHAFAILALRELWP